MYNNTFFQLLLNRNNKNVICLNKKKSTNKDDQINESETTVVMYI